MIFSGWLKQAESTNGSNIEVIKLKFSKPNPNPSPKFVEGIIQIEELFVTHHFKWITSIISPFYFHT